jgi:hypothetical protein
MYDESNELIERLREVCLAFPGIIEKEAWGECTFRVDGGKMFAMTDNDHHQSGHVAVWIMAPPTVQETLVHSMPQRFFKPPYVGPKGWVGVRLNQDTDWDELTAILRDGYLISAPATQPRRLSPGRKKSTAREEPQTSGAKATTAPLKRPTAIRPAR